jgi:hypothetical protein
MHKMESGESIPVVAVWHALYNVVVANIRWNWHSCGCGRQGCFKAFSSRFNGSANNMANANARANKNSNLNNLE